MEEVLVICGAVVAIGGAIAAINQYIIKPLKTISDKMDKVDTVASGQKVIAKGLSQLMEHILTGNNIDELENEYKKMRDYFIDSRD